MTGISDVDAMIVWFTEGWERAFYARKFKFVSVDTTGHICFWGLI